MKKERGEKPNSSVIISSADVDILHPCQDHLRSPAHVCNKIRRGPRRTSLLVWWKGRATWTTFTCRGRIAGAYKKSFVSSICVPQEEARSVTRERRRTGSVPVGMERQKEPAREGAQAVAQRSLSSWADASADLLFPDRAGPVSKSGTPRRGRGGRTLHGQDQAHQVDRLLGAARLHAPPR